MQGRRFTISELAEKLGVEFTGDPGLVLDGVAPLDEAGGSDLSFLANPKYAKMLHDTNAGAVVVSPDNAIEGKAHLVSDEPYMVFAKAVSLFHPPSHPGGGVHASAWVAQSARLGENVTVMNGATVCENASVGDNSVIYPGAYIGHGASIGADTVIYPNATIRERCIIGDRVIIQPGAVIGSDGFGFAMDAGGHQKFQQVGIVVVEDDVEIGANTTIDRAALGRTLIGRGTKIDNLVQIGHNVVIGAHSVIVSQVGISGSTVVGRQVVLAGQVGVAGHLKIGDGSMIGAKSGIMSDIPPGSRMSGHPIQDHRKYLRMLSAMRKLPSFQKEFEDMKKTIESLKERLHLKEKQ